MFGIQMHLLEYQFFYVHKQYNEEYKFSEMNSGWS